MQDKINKKIEGDVILNPMRLMVGDYVSNDSKGVYEIMKFNDKVGGVVTTNIKLIYTDEGNLSSNFSSLKIDILKAKPCFFSISKVEKKIKSLNSLLLFLKSNI